MSVLGERWGAGERIRGEGGKWVYTGRGDYGVILLGTPRRWRITSCTWHKVLNKSDLQKERKVTSITKWILGHLFKDRQWLKKKWRKMVEVGYIFTYNKGKSLIVFYITLSSIESYQYYLPKGVICNWLMHMEAPPPSERFPGFPLTVEWNFKQVERGLWGKIHCNRSGRQMGGMKTLCSKRNMCERSTTPQSNKRLLEGATGWRRQH